MSHAGHDDAVPVDPVAGFRHLGPRKQKPLKFARKIRGSGLMYGGEIVRLFCFQSTLPKSSKTALRPRDYGGCDLASSTKRQ